MRQCYVPVLQMDSNEMRQRVVKVVIVRLVQWELVRFPSIYAFISTHARPRPAARFSCSGGTDSGKSANSNTGYTHIR